MSKNTLLLLIPLLFSCATPQGKFTTIWNYVSKDKQTENAPPADTFSKKDTELPNPEIQIEENNQDDQMDKLNSKIDKLEGTLRQLNANLASNEAKKNNEKKDLLTYKFNISKIWNFVLNGQFEKQVYGGVSFTGTSPNNLFSFKLMITTSREMLELTITERIPMPADLQTFVPYKTLVNIETKTKLTNVVVMPSVTMPLANYKVKLGFGYVPILNSSVEVRTGLAYDIYFYFRHSDYRIRLLDGGEEKRVSIPSSLSSREFFSSITTVNLDFEMIHFEANFIINPNETKIALGAGLAW